jgi:hypothetical protein
MISSCGFLLILIIVGFLYYLFRNNNANADASAIGTSETIEGFTDYTSCYGGTARNNANVNATATANQVTGGEKPKTYAPPVNRSYMYTSQLPRGISVLEGKANDCMFAGQSTPAHYNPPCLTDKPYGNWQSSYYYWKYLPEMTSRMYDSCDMYRCSTCNLNGGTALAYGKETLGTGQTRVSPKYTCACSIDPKYYENPTEFCKRNPNSWPCPNSWMKNAPQIKDLTDPIKCVKPCNVKFGPQVPACKNDFGFNLAITGEVTDGRPIIEIRPEFEDILTC